MLVEMFHQTGCKQILQFIFRKRQQKRNYKNVGSSDNRYIDNRAKRISRETPFYPEATSSKLLIDFFRYLFRRLISRNEKLILESTT